MKTLPAAYQAHLDSGTTTLAYAILIERTDNQLYGFTSHDNALVLDITSLGYTGQTAFLFDQTQGLEASSIVTSAGLSVDNMELTTLNDGTLFKTDEVLQGRWQNAKFLIFRYNWSATPVTIANDVELLMRGTFGEVTINRDMIKIELRGLAQKLQQPIGEVSTKTCRARLGDSRCTKNLTTFTFTGTVTAVSSNSVFTTNVVQADNYFTEGIITFTSGNNSSISQKVKQYASGVFTISLPMILPIQVGDTFTAIAGCDKTLETCKTKFNNVLNFQGEPHRPLLDNLTKSVK